MLHAALRNRAALTHSRCAYTLLPHTAAFATATNRGSRLRALKDAAADSTPRKIIPSATPSSEKRKAGGDSALPFQAYTQGGGTTSAGRSTASPTSTPRTGTSSASRGTPRPSQPISGGQQSNTNAKTDKGGKVAPQPGIHPKSGKFIKHFTEADDSYRERVMSQFEPENNRHIQSRISKQAVDVEDVLQLVATQAERMDTQNCLSALTKIRKCMEHSWQEQQSEMKGGRQRKLNEQQLQQFQQYKLQSLQLLQQDVRFLKLLTWLAVAIQGERMDGSACSNILYDMYILQFYHEDVFNMLITLLLRKLPSLKTQEIIQSLHCLCFITTPSPFVTTISDIIQFMVQSTQPTAFSPINICQLYKIFAQLNVINEPLFTLLNEAITKQLYSLNARDVCDIMQALQKLQLTNSSVIPMLLRRAVTLLPHFNSFDFQVLCTTLAKMGEASQSVSFFQAVAKHILDEFQSKRKQLPAGQTLFTSNIRQSDLVLVVWSFATLRLSNPPLFTAVADYLHAHYSNQSFPVEYQYLAIFHYAITTMNVQHTPTLQQLCIRGRDHQFQALKPRYLAQLLWSVVVNGGLQDVEGTQLISRVVRYLNDNMKNLQFAPDEMYALHQAAQQIRVWHVQQRTQPIIQAAAAHLLNKGSNSSPVATATSTALTAASNSTSVAMPQLSFSGFHLTLSTLFKEQARAFESTLYTPARYTDFQADVHETLRGMNVGYDTDKYLDTAGYTVDAFIPSQLTVLSLDMPERFALNDKEMRLKFDSVKQQQLREYGYHVLHVPYFFGWRTLKSREAKVKFLQEQLATAPLKQRIQQAFKQQLSAAAQSEPAQQQQSASA